MQSVNISQLSSRICTQILYEAINANVGQTMTGENSCGLAVTRSLSQDGPSARPRIDATCTITPARMSPWPLGERRTCSPRSTPSILHRRSVMMTYASRRLWTPSRICAPEPSPFSPMICALGRTPVPPHERAPRSGSIDSDV